MHFCTNLSIQITNNTTNDIQYNSQIPLLILSKTWIGACKQNNRICIIFCRSSSKANWYDDDTTNCSNIAATNLIWWLSLNKWVHTKIALYFQWKYYFTHLLRTQNTWTQGPYILLCKNEGYFNGLRNIAYPLLSYHFNEWYLHHLVSFHSSLR